MVARDGPSLHQTRLHEYREGPLLYLSGSAQDWWRAMVSDWDRELPITWEDFRDEFLEKYFPVDLCIQKENEFTNLIQGHHTVSQYEARFIELAEFAPTIVLTDLTKARRFEIGLWPLIHLEVRPL